MESVDRAAAALSKRLDCLQLTLQSIETAISSIADALKPRSQQTLNRIVLERIDALEERLNQQRQQLDLRLRG